MGSVLSGILLFSVVIGATNVVKVRLQAGYSEKPWHFTVGFCLVLAICFSWLPFFQPAAGVIFGIAISFVCIVGWWTHFFASDLKYVQTVPSAYRDITCLSWRGAVPKTLEVLIQDMSAWLIVGGLFILFDSLLVVIALFSVAVFLLHVPGLHLFGSVYGGYFLVVATMMSVVVPLVYTFGQVGFLLTYAIHLLGYIVMYISFSERTSTSTSVISPKKTKRW